MSLVNDIFHAISDHGNAVLSKFVTYFGVVSIGSGGALGVANGTASKVAQDQFLTLPDYAAIVSIIGGICLVIKNAVDIYYKIKEKRSEKEED